MCTMAASCCISPYANEEPLAAAGNTMKSNLPAFLPLLGLLAVASPVDAAAPGMALSQMPFVQSEASSVVLVAEPQHKQTGSSKNSVQNKNGGNPKSSNGVRIRVGEGKHRGTRYSWGSGFWFYDGYYHGDCQWLKRRYRETGSRYWLERYRQCREY